MSIDIAPRFACSYRPGTRVTQLSGYLFGGVSSLTNEYHENLDAPRHEGLTRTASGALFLVPTLEYGLCPARGFGHIIQLKSWLVRTHWCFHFERLPSRILDARSSF